MAPRLRSATLVCVLTAGFTGGAQAEDASAFAASAGLGISATRLELDRTVDGADTSAAGGFAGVHGHWQRNARFRAEASLMSGSLDVDSPGQGPGAETATFFETRATWGIAMPAARRLYAGIGYEQVRGDSPFGGGEGTSWSAYVPVGFAVTAPFRGQWSARVTLEGRINLAGAEEIDDVPGVGDVDYDRSGGFGVAFSVDFRPHGAPVSIEPYVKLVRPADTETVEASGTQSRVTGLEDASGGVRVQWLF